MGDVDDVMGGVKYGVAGGAAGGIAGVGVNAFSQGQAISGAAPFAGGTGGGALGYAYGSGLLGNSIITLIVAGSMVGFFVAMLVVLYVGSRPQEPPRRRQRAHMRTLIKR